jgi:hypothetical protein
MGLFFNACSSNNVKSERPSQNDTTKIKITSPPFHGTIFIASHIVTPSDSSTFKSNTYEGQKSRTIFDRREGKFVDANVFIFKTQFNDGVTFETWVNPEFDSVDSAKMAAQKYDKVIGRIPAVLRKGIKHLTVNKGTEAFGGNGGTGGLLIHTGMAKNYEKEGILAETLVHESTHISLQPKYNALSGWMAAQEDDPTFISTYAKENSEREDMAESFLPYIDVRYRSDRISKGLADTIKAAMPRRIAFFDSVIAADHLNMSPFKKKEK